MKNEFENTLKQFEQILARKNAQLLEALNDGISDGEIVGTLKKNNIGLILPDDVFALYNWKNGIGYDLQIDPSFFTLGIFMPFDDATKAYLYYTEQEPLWEKKLFPLFESRGGDYFLIDCDKQSKDYEKLFIYSPLTNPFYYEESVISYVDSLNNLFKCILDFYNNDIYVSDFSREKLIVNTRKRHEIFEKNNPQSEYWKKMRELSKQ